MRVGPNSRRLTSDLWSLLELTAEYIPEMTSKLEHYSGHQPISIL